MTKKEHLPNGKKIADPLHGMVMRLRRWFASIPCRMGSHDWLIVRVKGGKTGLIYSRRTCVRCLEREMQTSRNDWVKPFELKHDWEREDFETGSHYGCG